MLRKLNNDILVGFLVASLFWVGVFVWQSTQPAHHKGAGSQPCEGTKSECAKAATDERIADYTWWLAVLNAALVTVAAVQGYFLLRSDKTARIAANAAEQAATAAGRQARIAESALFAVEIPYLYIVVKSHAVTVENYAIKKIGTMNADGITIDEGYDFSNVITFCFENVGRTPAEIIEFSAEIRFEEFPPAPVIRAAKPSRWATETVPARGRSRDRSSTFGTDLLIGGGMNREKEALWFKGYVRYADVFKNEYIYGFCLGFDTFAKDGTGGEFYTSGGDDYNYRKKVKTSDLSEPAL
ncbi:MAG: hypothetical protein QOH32_4528 [Bradyrhizobium sp.]|jgi:hypothetical protein|nr:hypothetical protein [Bradyrhizobium sp.]